MRYRMNAVHGPTCIPWRNMFGGSEGHPHHPGDYGRYLPIDLDANNVHTVDEWCARHPGEPRPVLGWGVCRHGFGLQHHVGVLSEAQADEWAHELNAAIVIGGAA